MSAPTYPYIEIEILKEGQAPVTRYVRIGNISGAQALVFQNSITIEDLNLNLEFQEEVINIDNFVANQEDEIVVSQEERNVFNLIKNILAEEQTLVFNDFATKEYVDSQNFTNVINTENSVTANQFPNNTLIVVDNGSLRNVTINNDGPIGTMYTIYRRGAGAVNVNGSGITLIPGNRAISFRYRAISVIKIAANT
jgi:hypothetical protein